ncbi:MAG: hypothetical protein WC437_01790 [Patescibacteria group bacterium]|jgi:hypothetical protein
MNKNIVFDIDKKSGLSKEELKGLMEKWQVKLNMLDWVLELKIVDFNRPDFKQSGDFIADPKKKKATILLTSEPWRDDEEYTLVHEMVHVLFFDFDKFSEESLLQSYKNQGKEHDLYMEKLESLVHHVTQILLGRKELTGSER